jgi:hypothetical protein
MLIWMQLESASLEKSVIKKQYANLSSHSAF